MPGYIYLIRVCGTDFYKIGSASNPKARLGRLQIGNPSKLELVTERKVDNSEAEEYEIHKRWEKYAVRGEWFNFHPTEMPAVLSEFDTFPPDVARLAIELSKHKLRMYRREATSEASRTGALYADRAIAAIHAAVHKAPIHPDLADELILSFLSELAAAEGRAQARADIRKA